MAHEEHIALIHQGVAAWNQWRADNPDIMPDLVGAGLGGLDLTGANLDNAHLKKADLRGTILNRASLVRADLAGANLFKAIADGAELAGANLSGVRFLECARLTAARNWQLASRDEALACGAPIPAPEIECRMDEAANPGANGGHSRRLNPETGSSVRGVGPLLRRGWKRRRRPKGSRNQG